MKMHDLIIIGAGPAGLSAAVYAARYNLKTLVLGKVPGGQITDAWKICNFPTYNEIGGVELAKKMLEQAKKLKVPVKNERAIEVKKRKLFDVATNHGRYNARKILIATGTERRKLNAKGEKEFDGKGVSYCAVCDAALYRGKITAVVGGSDAALSSALLLAEYAKKVYIIYRQGKFFRAEPAWIKLVEKNKKIIPVFNSNVIEIFGERKVKGIRLDNGKEMKIDGLFIEVGSIPDEELPRQLGLKTDEGYIIVNKNQETNVSGVYAAGDITNNSLKQAVTACGEGAIAANSAWEKLKKEKGN